MGKYMTKNWAKDIIASEKESKDTAYFNGELGFYDMYEMLRYRFGFGEHETVVILAALVNAGCKIRVE